MKDTIYRQAAIDALCMEWCGVKHQDCKHPFDAEKDDYYWCDGCETALRTLPALPSAQPERTCVNCGRTINNGGWCADGGTRCPIEEHYALPKDGFCHLWEKWNVVDDDYPELWRNKSDVTHEALCAVAQHLLFEEKEFRFQHKDEWYVMKIERLEE